tara:strand:- start:244 stop:603 length:360 start_codon:yes stop_codon:yes gene_type:complete
LALGERRAIVIALTISFWYHTTPLGWTSHGERTLDDLVVEVASSGALRRGQSALLRVSAAEPLDLRLLFEGGQTADISRADWTEGHVEVTLGTGSGSQMLLSLESGSHRLNWDLGATPD